MNDHFSSSFSLVRVEWWGDQFVPGTFIILKWEILCPETLSILGQLERKEECEFSKTKMYFIEGLFIYNGVLVSAV